MNRKQLGQLGEQYAAQYIRSLQMNVLQTNWRCSSGEIDLIAQDRDVIVFVEVRTRTIRHEATSLQRYGSVLEAVTPNKQKQVKKVAEIYIYKNRLYNQSIRFDVVLVEYREGSLQAKHIINAF